MREEPAPGVRIQLYEKSGLSSKIWTESGPISTKKIPDPDQSLEIRTKVGSLRIRLFTLSNQNNEFLTRCYTIFVNYKLGFQSGKKWGGILVIPPLTGVDTRRGGKVQMGGD